MEKNNRLRQPVYLVETSIYYYLFIGAPRILRRAIKQCLQFPLSSTIDTLQTTYQQLEEDYPFLDFSCFQIFTYQEWQVSKAFQICSDYLYPDDSISDVYGICMDQLCEIPDPSSFYMSLYTYQPLQWSRLLWKQWYSMFYETCDHSLTLFIRILSFNFPTIPKALWKQQIFVFLQEKESHPRMSLEEWMQYYTSSSMPILLLQRHILGKKHDNYFDLCYIPFPSTRLYSSATIDRSSPTEFTKLNSPINHCYGFYYLYLDIWTTSTSSPHLSIYLQPSSTWKHKNRKQRRECIQEAMYTTTPDRFHHQWTVPFYEPVDLISFFHSNHVNHQFPYLELYSPEHREKDIKILREIWKYVKSRKEALEWIHTVSHRVKHVIFYMVTTSIIHQFSIYARHYGVLHVEREIQSIDWNSLREYLWRYDFSEDLIVHDRCHAAFRLLSPAANHPPWTILLYRSFVQWILEHYPEYFKKPSTVEDSKFSIVIEYHTGSLIKYSSQSNQCQVQCTNPQHVSSLVLFWNGLIRQFLADVSQNNISSSSLPPPDLSILPSTTIDLHTIEWSSDTPLMTAREGKMEENKGREGQEGQEEEMELIDFDFENTSPPPPPPPSSQQQQEESMLMTTTIDPPNVLVHARDYPFPEQVRYDLSMLKELYLKYLQTTIQTSNDPLIRQIPTKLHELSPNGANIPIFITKSILRDILRQSPRGVDHLTIRNNRLLLSESPGILPVHFQKKSDDRTIDGYFICPEFWCFQCRFPWYIDLSSTPYRYFCKNNHENIFYQCPGCRNFAIDHPVEYKYNYKCYHRQRSSLPLSGTGKKTECGADLIWSQEMPSPPRTEQITMIHRWAPTEGQKKKQIVSFNKNCIVACFVPKKQRKENLDVFNPKQREKMNMCRKSVELRDVFPDDDPDIDLVSYEEESSLLVSAEPEPNPTSSVPKERRVSSPLILSKQKMIPYHTTGLPSFFYTSLQMNKETFQAFYIPYESALASWMSVFIFVWKQFLLLSASLTLQQVPSCSMLETFYMESDQHCIHHILSSRLSPSMYTQLHQGTFLSQFSMERGGDNESESSGIIDERIQHLLPESPLLQRTLHHSYQHFYQYLTDSSVQHSLSILLHVFTYPTVLFPQGCSFFYLKEVVEKEEIRYTIIDSIYHADAPVVICYHSSSSSADNRLHLVMYHHQEESRIFLTEHECRVFLKEFASFQIPSYTMKLSDSFLHFQYTHDQLEQAQDQVEICGQYLSSRLQCFRLLLKWKPNNTYFELSIVKRPLLLTIPVLVKPWTRHLCSSSQLREILPLLHRSIYSRWNSTNKMMINTDQDSYLFVHDEIQTLPIRVRSRRPPLLKITFENLMCTMSPPQIDRLYSPHPLGLYHPPLRLEIDDEIPIFGIKDVEQKQPIFYHTLTNGDEIPINKPPPSSYEIKTTTLHLESSMENIMLTSDYQSFLDYLADTIHKKGDPLKAQILELYRSQDKRACVEWLTPLYMQFLQTSSSTLFLSSSSSISSSSIVDMAVYHILKVPSFLETQLLHRSSTAKQEFPYIHVSNMDNAQEWMQRLYNEKQYFIVYEREEPKSPIVSHTTSPSPPHPWLSTGQWWSTILPWKYITSIKPMTKESLDSTSFSFVIDIFTGSIHFLHHIAYDDLPSSPIHIYLQKGDQYVSLTSKKNKWSQLSPEFRMFYKQSRRKRTSAL